MSLPTDINWAPRFMRVLGDELRAIRKQRGWTRLALHARLSEDISLQTLATYELGTRKLSVCRFVSICIALEVSPADTIQQTLKRIRANNDQEPHWTVDLVAASKLTLPELAPLRRWAELQLHTGPDTIVRLSRDAVGPLASLCGLDTDELARRLPQPRATQVE